MVSAVEAELGRLFFNAQEVIILQINLEELGQPKPPTTSKIDNLTAAGIVNKPLK